jgi:hypothetical protein
MTYRQKVCLALLTAAVAITRFLFRSRYLYDLDSVNFALAMQRFDPRVHQPHPPGYFLYICLGRALNVFFHDANLALVVLSILASCGLVIVIYKMTMDWFGPMAAQFAGILFLLSPLAWFHGIVALTYIVEAFFSALLGLLCWRIDSGRAGFILPAAIALGVSAGVRPSSLVFLAPLFLFSLRKATVKERWMGLAALVVTLAAWFVPMIVSAGGLSAYFGALTSLWRMVPSKSTVFNSSPANSVARAFVIIFIFLLIFGAASLASLRALASSSAADTRKKNFTLVWIAPALCFFTFGYLKFVTSGYLLLLCAPACMWLGLWVSEWYQTSQWPRSMKLTVIAVGTAANVFIFIASPFYCSYLQVRRFERELEGIKTAIPQVGSAQDTLILSFDSHFNGFRHAGYYLPDYLTVEYPEAHLNEGPRIFSMYERETRLVTALPSAPYTRFVLFPLPEEDSYKQYIQKVIERFPDKSLHTVHSDGREFVTGSIADLPLLFPEATVTTGRSVYVPLHPGKQPVNSRSH